MYGNAYAYLCSTLAEAEAHNISKPVYDVDSSAPDGYKSENLVGAKDNNLEDGPIEEDSAVGVLVAVNRNDENKYTPEQWADILEKVKKGEILFFETLAEEVEYFHERTIN